MLERETKREKILESKQREIKLKFKHGVNMKREDEMYRRLQPINEVGTEEEENGLQKEEQSIQLAEKDFFKLVKRENNRRNNIKG